MIYAMNTNAERLGCRDAEVFMKNSEERDAIWCTTYDHWKQSLVCAVEGFNDKFVTVLGAGKFGFYPLHLTLLNFTGEWRRSYVQHGYTILAYPLSDLTLQMIRTAMMTKSLY